MNGILGRFFVSMEPKFVFVGTLHDRELVGLILDGLYLDSRLSGGTGLNSVDGDCCRV